MVRPHVEYAQSVWSPWRKKDIQAIENVQRRATKRLPGMKNLTYEERLKKMDLPTLVYRRARGDMIEMYKMVQGLYDEEVVPRWERREGTTRGHDWKLYKRRATTKVRSHYFMYRVVETWNSLPASVVDAPTIYTFERRLDNYWRDQEFKFNSEATLTTRRLPEASNNEDLDIEA